MTPETIQQTQQEQPDSLPFPYSQRPYCPYEPVEKTIKKIRVLVVNDLLRDESDLSELARREWGDSVASKLERERYISGLAVDNIVNNIKRLVEEPAIHVAHLSEAVEAAGRFRPEAIVLSGTLTDFDYYNPEMLRRFAAFAVKTMTPILGICGGHQLIGLCFGVPCTTLDNREPGEQREGRSFEYQYRFIRITDPEDPIFSGIRSREQGVWQDYTTEGDILRVWQNHGLQLPRLPEGFQLLATSYLCRNQMMVKRADGQLIYTVQFHLEKSFEDWNKSRTRWEHPNDSRDGRILFENFLTLATRN